MPRSPLTTRDRGFALVRRLNRWIVAGAIALSGGLSIAAANAFHGRTRGQTSNGAAVSHGSSGGTSSSENGGSTSNNSGAGGLQPPAQAPSSAPASPGGGVVSGGS